MPLKNVEERKEYNQKYYKEHREEILNQKKEYESKCKERINNYAKQYRDTHKKEMYEYQHKYRIDNPHKIAVHRQRRRMTKKNIGGNGITIKQWKTVMQEYNGLCAYCSQKKRLTMDHIVPIDNGGKHELGNVVPTCQSCNSSKSDTSLLLFLYYRLGI